MNTYKPHEFADMLGVTVKTLQRWDVSGKLKAYRSPTDRRYYTHKQYVDYVGEGNSKHVKTIVYTRVSTLNQKDDLSNQISFYENGVSPRTPRSAGNQSPLHSGDDVAVPRFA